MIEAALAFHPTAVFAGAIAGARGDDRASALDIAYAALAVVAMAGRGYAVRQVARPADDDTRLAVVAHALAEARDVRAPRPREYSEAERIVGFLWRCGWDVCRGEGA